MPANDSQTPAPFSPSETTATAAPDSEGSVAPRARSTEGVPVTDVAIIIGYRDRNGRRQEVIHDIHDKRILKFVHTSQAKVEKVKVDGQLVDFAPTGEVQVKLEFTYLDV